MSLEVSTGQENSQKQANRVAYPSKNVNNLGILLAKMLGNLKCLAFNLKTSFQPEYVLMAAH